MTAHTTDRWPEGLEVLRAAMVFRGFDQGTLQEILAGCDHRFYAAGQDVLTLGDDSDTTCVVVAGRVLLSLLSEGGQQLLLDERGSGTVFLLNGASSEPAAALICTAAPGGATVYRFQTERLLGLCPSNGQSAVDLVRLLQRQVTEQQVLLAEQTFCSLQQKLARKLLRLARRHGGCIRYTREDLARMVGTTREPATRALSELRDEGLIAYTPRGRDIAIVDRVRLERRAYS